MSSEIVLKFDQVSFQYGPNKPVLNEVSFSVRQGMKIALMGQNGSGKSTIFNLITGGIQLESGKINLNSSLSIAIARQVISREQMNLTVREFFEACFKEKVYDIDPRIKAVLEIVNLSAPLEKIIKAFSGGQQARLLLASALISNPDILLLDEPTNNLDKEGIKHLTDFLIKYQKTVIVISHDADFLNSFTDGILYLDIHTKKIEQYQGNYFKVVREITVRIEKENMKNAQLAKEIQRNKDQSNVFAHKGGRLRLVAKRMREKADELEEAKVDVRKEDKTIRPFTIPLQEGLSGVLISINSLTVIKNHKPHKVKVKISLNKNQHLLLAGPNGIGKSSLLESIVTGKSFDHDYKRELTHLDEMRGTIEHRSDVYDTVHGVRSGDGDEAVRQMRKLSKGAVITEGVKVGYYRQDFSTLDFNSTVYDSLVSAMEKFDEQEMRSTAASFLITGEIIHTKIGNLSEGQKGLVAFARLVIEKPGLLILDEPTNHINFRHLPIIAEALNKYLGAMIIVSHVPDFIKKIRIDEVLDLEKIMN